MNKLYYAGLIIIAIGLLSIVLKVFGYLGVGGVYVIFGNGVIAFIKGPLGILDQSNGFEADIVWGGEGMIEAQWLPGYEDLGFGVMITLPIYLFGLVCILTWGIHKIHMRRANNIKEMRSNK